MDAVLDLAYLVASALFILGIRGLTHPRTAVRGNALGATGMLIAIIATLLDQQVLGSGAQAFGLIIYSRNLTLIFREQRRAAKG